MQDFGGGGGEGYFYLVLLICRISGVEGARGIFVPHTNRKKLNDQAPQNQQSMSSLKRSPRLTTYKDCFCCLAKDDLLTTCSL